MVQCLGLMLGRNYMKLNELSKEELEQFSYEELTKYILEEEKEPLNTPAIFKKICSLLDMSDDEYADKIGDFYTSLTTDKDFVLLEDGKWDLRDHHPAPVILEDDEDIYEEDNPESFEEEEEDFEEIIDPDMDDDDTSDIDDDIDEDFSIIDEEDENMKLED